MNPATARSWGWEPTGHGFAVDPNARARFERTVGFFEQVLVPALHRGGVGLLAGTDAPIAAIIPGFALVGELRSFERAGLTRWEALRTATENAARFLNRPGEFGVIAVGAAADLVLLDANPLANLAALHQPRGVMVRGRWLSRNALDTLLNQLATAYAR
jgi:imidazolonepropionase-like amidohydrolase